MIYIPWILITLLMDSRGRCLCRSLRCGTYSSHGVCRPPASGLGMLPVGHSPWVVVSSRGVPGDRFFVESVDASLVCFFKTELWSRWNLHLKESTDRIELWHFIVIVIGWILVFLKWWVSFVASWRMDDLWSRRRIGRSEGLRPLGTQMEGQYQFLRSMSIPHLRWHHSFTTLLLVEYHMALGQN